MAGRYHRNDSPQMRAVLQGEGLVPPSPSPPSSPSSPSPASPPSPASSPPSSPPSSPAALRGRRGETGEEAGGGVSPSGCALADLKHLPRTEERRGRLTFSKTDAVLVNVDVFNREGRLVAQQGADRWSSSVVKLPCSPSSTMLKPGNAFKAAAPVRRWEVISKQLGALARKTAASAEDVEDAVMKYNPRYKGQWSFHALCRFVKIIPETENYFPKLFPKMAALALRLPDYVKKSVPLLRRGEAASVTLSQVQISCLLANAFFCTFPHRNTTSPTAEYHTYPSINFTSLLGKCSERKEEKLRAVLHYFHVMTDEKTKPDGLVTFERRRVKDSRLVDWGSCKKTMNKLYVSSDGTIETEGTGLLQVDFASSWIGGGVLGSGLVQEEILFLMSPELIVSRLFTEKLADNECLVVTGSQQFSSYSGFGGSFEWAGPHQDALLRQVGSAAEADRGHRRDSLQTQEGSIQHDQREAGTQQGVLRVPAPRQRRAGRRHGQVGLRRLQRRPSAQSHDPADGGGGSRQGFGLLHLQGRGAGAGPVEDAPPAGGGGGDGREAVQTPGGLLRRSAGVRRLPRGPVPLHQDQHRALQESAVRRDSIQLERLDTAIFCWW